MSRLICSREPSDRRARLSPRISSARAEEQALDRADCEALDLAPVPLPRLARQPEDAELRLALRFRRRQLHADRADSGLAASRCATRRAAFAGVAPDDIRPRAGRPLRSRRRHRLAQGPRRVRPGRRRVARTRRRPCASGSARPAASERASLEVEPRSAYLLSGEARHDWEHSIVPGDELRFSITFRTLSDLGRRKAAEAQRIS